MITTLFETLRALPKPVLLNVGDLLRLRGKGGAVALSVFEWFETDGLISQRRDWLIGFKV